MEIARIQLAIPSDAYAKRKRLSPEDEWVPQFSLDLGSDVDSVAASDISEIFTEQMSEKGEDNKQRISNSAYVSISLPYFLQLDVVDLPYHECYYVTVERGSEIETNRVINV